MAEVVPGQLRGCLPELSLVKRALGVVMSGIDGLLSCYFVGQGGIVMHHLTILRPGFEFGLQVMFLFRFAGGSL
jgi:hypothetical protein